MMSLWVVVLPCWREFSATKWFRNRRKLLWHVGERIRGHVAPIVSSQLDQAEPTMTCWRRPLNRSELMEAVRMIRQTLAMPMRRTIQSCRDYFSLVSSKILFKKIRYFFSHFNEWLIMKSLLSVSYRFIQSSANIFHSFYWLYQSFRASL